MTPLCPATEAEMLLFCPTAIATLRLPLLVLHEPTVMTAVSPYLGLFHIPAITPNWLMTTTSALLLETVVGTTEVGISHQIVWPLTMVRVRRVMRRVFMSILEETE